MISLRLSRLRFVAVQFLKPHLRPSRIHSRCLAVTRGTMYHVAYHPAQTSASYGVVRETIHRVKNGPNDSHAHHDNAPDHLLIASSGLTFGEFKFPWSSALKAKLLTVSSTRFRFSYIDKANPVKWRLCQKMFEASDAESCAQWVEQINTAIARHNTDRPSELLVFVNPFGGHRMAMSTYKHAASPVFTAAGIRATVVSTERGGHASDYIRSHKDLSKFGGIVAVGGDGFFHEILNAVIDTGNNHIRLGLIPGGSTNTIVYSLHGTLDPATAAMHIALGERMPLDLCHTTTGKGHSRYTSSMVAYGFYADNIEESESMRWLGPARYDLSGFKAFLSLKSYSGTIRFKRAAGEPEDVCRAGCPTCRPDPKEVSKKSEPLSPRTARGANDSGVFLDDVDSEESVPDESGWEVRSGEFVAVNLAVISCKHPKAPNGMAPHAHLSDGTVTLVMVKKCTQPEYLYHLTCLAHQEADHFEFPFIETAVVTEFEFEADAKAAKSQWMVDGELTGSADLWGEAVHNMIHVFGSRPPALPRAMPRRRATAA